MHAYSAQIQLLSPYSDQWSVCSGGEELLSRVWEQRPDVEDLELSEGEK